MRPGCASTSVSRKSWSVVKESSTSSNRQGPGGAFPRPRPQGGQPHGTGPLGGAFLIPRPLAEDPYSRRSGPLSSRVRGRGRGNDGEVGADPTSDGAQPLHAQPASMEDLRG